MHVGIEQHVRSCLLLYVNYVLQYVNGNAARASHESQYTRYFAYSDALKNSFFPRTIPMWISLPSSVVSSKTIEELKAQI